MKVAFVIEYFPPFAPGGAEWSTYYLAQNLAKKGTEIVVITPNLGAKPQEFFGKVKVRRFPFYLKLKNKNSLPGNFAYTNPLWMLWSTIFYFKYLKEEDPDIIHIQGKYSAPAIIAANIFLKKPTVATVRDYMAICNYGICLMTKDKACNLLEYFTRDFKKYYQIYVAPKNLATFALNLVFAIWGRLSKNLLKFFVNRSDYLTAMSQKQKQILQKNGIKRPIEIIHNSFVFEKLEKNFRPRRNILFVGRLTYGKGVDLLLKAIPLILKKTPDYKFIFIGKGPLKGKIEELSKSQKEIKLVGHLSHNLLGQHYKDAAATVVPSVWPEPLARVAIEALSFGTPVVVTRSGGLPEVIKDGVYGRTAGKSPQDLADKVIEVIKNNMNLKKNIYTNFPKIKTTFTTDVANSHIKLYRHLLK